MNKKPPGVWSWKYEQCMKCGTKSKPYFSKGMCGTCYFEAYTPAHIEAIQAYKRKWYRKAGGKEWAKRLREQRNYSNLREPAMKRDNYRCVRCGSSKQLCVHHKDRNGRGKEKPNNTLENLEVVCRACHLNIHRLEFPNRSVSMRKAWITRRKNIQTRKAG